MGMTLNLEFLRELPSLGRIVATLKGACAWTVCARLASEVLMPVDYGGGPPTPGENVKRPVDYGGGPPTP